MRIENRKLSIIWKLAILVFGLYGLLDGAGILSGHYTSNFPHMFTNISNMFAWAYFACAVLWMLSKKGRESDDTFAPFFKYTATVSLLVTMIIGHIMLFNALFQNGHIVWHLVILHYIVPIMTLLDWLLFDEKGEMPVWGPLTWESLALAYLAFSMIAVGVFGIYMGGGTTADVTNYPYTFLDPQIAGIGGVIGFCAGMVVMFIILGYILYGFDHWMAKRAEHK